MSDFVGSTPSITGFDPVIPYQKKLINCIRKNYSYSQGTHEVLLSGSVGSAKSMVAAHLGVTHCLMFPRARLLLGRRSLPDVKATIYNKIKEHIETDLVEGRDYESTDTIGRIIFSNGSEIICKSWADKKYKRFRSLDLSAAIFEEIIENEGDDINAYKEIKMRVGRLPHVPENWIISNTNPGSPSSYWYKYFIEKQTKTRHVFYSLTEQNPFLPEKYIEQLKQDMDPKEAKRMLYGEWIDLTQDVVYYNYQKQRNFKDTKYTFNEAYPIDLSFDFNIADNKPMSASVGQFIGDTFHVAKDFVVHGARTLDILEEMSAYNLFDHPCKFRVFGDASGTARDTRSVKSDYDIIKEFLANFKNKHGSSLNWEYHVPRSNPPIRTRHNTANAQFLNALGQVNLYVYQDAQTVDEGFRLTKLKRGSNYLEDDSEAYQHVTTAVTYWVYYLKFLLKEKRQPYSLF